MRIRVAVPDESLSPDVVGPVLEAVTRVNEDMIRKGQSPTARELIRGGAIWRPEPPGDEHFDHGGTIASRGWGDCDDWAPLHAASLRATGEDPGAHAFVAPSGPNTYHAMVRRSDGSVDDPSVEAGMKPAQVIGSDGQMGVWALDPHDGRVYQGALLPTTGPLSLHPGAQMVVRGVTIIGVGPLYQARVDLPICGSTMRRMRAHKRRHHQGRRRVHGMVPHALSVTHLAASREAALQGALCGAVLAADACDTASTLDRYKLLAVQSGMAGMGSEDLRNGLYMHLQADMHARPDCLAKMLWELHAPMTGDFLHDCWTLASSIVLAVGSVIQGAGVGDFFSDFGDVVRSVTKPIEQVYNAIPSPVKAVLAPQTLVTEYAYAHPEQIPLFGDVAKKAKGIFESIKNKGGTTDQAVQHVVQAIHPSVVPPTHATAAHVMMHLRAPPAPPPPPMAPAWSPPPMPSAPLPWSMPPMPQMPSFDPDAYASDNGDGDDPFVQGAPRRKPKGIAHAAMPVRPGLPPHPTAMLAPSLAGAPTGRPNHWNVSPLQDGSWACSG